MPRQYAVIESDALIWNGTLDSPGHETPEDAVATAKSAPIATVRRQRTGPIEVYHLDREAKTVDAVRKEFPCGRFEVAAAVT